MKQVISHKYNKRGSSSELFRSRELEVLMSGPAGTGKTRACLEYILALALRYEGMKALALRKTMVSLTSSGIQTWKNDVAPEMLAGGAMTFFGGSQQEPAQYRFNNGSSLAVGGLDNITKVMSTEYDMIYVQEAIELKEDDWESLTSRLRNDVMPWQQLIADTNPSHPEHWLKQRCNIGLTKLIECRHEDNPKYFDKQGKLTESGKKYIPILDRLTGVRYHRLRSGLWVASEGIIYEEYDPAIHLIKRFEIPKEWTRWLVVDFGYEHPFVAQWWAEDPDGRLFMYREIYMTKKLVEDHAKVILSFIYDDHNRLLEPKPRAIICDHDAEDRATLERHLKMPTRAARKTVSPGIQAVQSRFKFAGDGKPRLFFLKDSLVEIDQRLRDRKLPICTPEEFSGYIWADGEKEKPVKERDDGADCTRYIVAERDLRPTFGYRSLT